MIKVMLKELHIHNIILIEDTKLNFSSSFNVLTGETGAGKSAIMEALRLILGCRLDTNVIRKGKDKAFVEGVFTLSPHLPITSLLEKEDIVIDFNEDIVIRREISSKGKSRAFINDQLITLSTLKQITDHLIEITGQHASQKLRAIETHRKVLDTFADLLPLQEQVATAFYRVETIEKKLKKLKESKEKRSFEITRLKEEIQELEEANILENEEDTLFKQYSLLSSAEERLKKCCDISQNITSSLTFLNETSSQFEELATQDISLKEAFEAFKNAKVELEEVHYTLQTYQGSIECNPLLTEQVNQRLTLINRLKRKYGQDLCKYLSHAKEQLHSLENIDFDLEELSCHLENAKRECDQLCKKLTSLRKQAIKNFEKQIIEQLRLLKMESANFYISIKPQKRSPYGDDRIEFFFCPNVGEKTLSISECASGGEMSRILLSIQLLLSGKMKIPTLIFDEIDANIGGETASFVGKMLSTISTKNQIICITHFPQVASFADHHIHVWKEEKNGRTYTLTKVLLTEEKKHELARMQGLCLSNI